MSPHHCHSILLTYRLYYLHQKFHMFTWAQTSSSLLFQMQISHDWFTWVHLKKRREGQPQSLKVSRDWPMSKNRPVTVGFEPWLKISATAYQKWLPPTDYKCHPGATRQICWKDWNLRLLYGGRSLNPARQQQLNDTRHQLKIWSDVNKLPLNLSKTKIHAAW